ncbi:MAG: ribosomal-processing cysteine protease Prp [Eubacterium sp.]|jgi:hypothetical protein|nr:ribosomal-processing cysteine protease Prp [Eubacterium sp.]
MIQIDVKKSESGDIIGFYVSGHAGFSPCGTDVVCAGISVLVFNCINSIEQFSKTRFDLIQNETDGIIDFSCKEPLDDKANLLLRSMFLGVQGIQDTYGSKYVTLH